MQAPIPLPASITDDDDSHEDAIPRYSVPNMDGKEDVDPRALAYLLRYETMVRQQEAEDMATSAHLRPLLERIQHLGSQSDDTCSFGDARLMQRTVSYKVLERALDVLEASSEVMTTDKQLMMVLRTLTGKAPTTEETITWAEFLQCYKTVVAGMQTLQHLPAASSVRSRARDRTLSILSLFEPASSKLLAEGFPSTIDVNNRSFSSTAKYELKSGPAKKLTFERVIMVTIVLATLVLGAFFNSAALHNAFGRSIEIPNDVRAAEESSAGSSPIAALNNTQPIASLGDLSAGTLSHDEQQATMASLLQQNPSVEKLVKRGMIRSAVVGGAAGMVIAPTAFNGFQLVVPKLSAGITSVAPGTAGLCVAIILTVGSVAFSGALRKGCGSFFSRVFRALRKNKEYMV